MDIEIGAVLGVLGFAITVGGICVTFGVLKGKILSTEEWLKEQKQQLKTRASKADFERYKVDTQARYKELYEYKHIAEVAIDSVRELKLDIKELTAKFETFVVSQNNNQRSMDLKIERLYALREQDHPNSRNPSRRSGDPLQ